MTFQNQIWQGILISKGQLISKYKPYIRAEFYEKSSLKNRF